MTPTGKNVSSHGTLCSNCGSRDILVNEYGVHQCRNCLSTWEYGWTSRREGSHRTSGEPTLRTWEKLEEAADFYGYSPRCFYDQVRNNRVLGIKYENGSLTFNCDANEVKGPLADVPTEVILPVGTKAVSPEVCPESLTSGRPYVIGINTARKHPVGTFQCEPGYSGPMVRIVCQF